MDEAPPGGLVGQFPWSLSWLLALAALLTREPVVVVLLGAVLIAGTVSEVTARLAHEGLRVHVRLSDSHVIAGEDLQAIVEVENAKPLPLTWCEVRIPLPEGVEPSVVRADQARSRLDAVLSLRAKERLRIRFPIRAAQRGAYAVGAATVRTGDWLGFFSEERDAAEPADLVAYPRPLPARVHDVPALRPLAERATRRGLLPDLLRFAGIREHRPSDARKDIHWKATARLARLQTRVFEPATSGDVVFLVNVASHPSYWIQADPDAVEVVVASTATLVREAAAQGRQFGLLTNGIDAITHERPRALLGRGPGKLRRGLEMLARLSPYAAAAPESLFLREHGRIAWGATLICVTPSLGQALADTLVRLRRMGHRVVVSSVQEVDDRVQARCRAHRIAIGRLAASDVEI